MSSLPTCSSLGKQNKGRVVSLESLKEGIRGNLMERSEKDEGIGTSRPNSFEPSCARLHESTVRRSSTTDNQLVREKATDGNTGDTLLQAAQILESMPLHYANDQESGLREDSMLCDASLSDSLQSEDDSVPTSMKSMPEVVQHEVMPPKQNKETLSSTEQRIPSFTLATESLPHSITVRDHKIERQSVYETIKIPLLTFDEYMQQRWQHIKFIMQELKQEYIDELWALLIQPPYNYSENTASKFAEDLLDPRSKFSCNPVTASELDETLDRYRKMWQQTEKEQLLMLRFPLHKVSKVNKHKLSLDEDDESRKQQNKEFVRRYGGNPRVRPERIEDKDKLFQRISFFLYKDCSSTCLATIVFNGHGSKDGLHVHSGPIPLTDIINHVQLSMDDIKSRRGTIQMPRAVDIVFAQCYGHVHGHPESPSELVNVISLASNQRPRSYQNIKSSEESAHYELESFADKRKRLKQEAQVNSPAIKHTTKSFSTPSRSCNIPSISNSRTPASGQQNIQAVMKKKRVTYV